MTDQLRIVDHDERWAERFAALGSSLRAELGAEALRIDHIGSTSVAGLAAKDIIDVQVTVVRLTHADAWSEALLPGLTRRGDKHRDHVPPGASELAADWEKRLWARPHEAHVHVREDGRANQRYALLFRDYLRADATAAQAYAHVKRMLALHVPDDWEAYYAVKDPACDLIWAGAQQWAERTGWELATSDA